MSQIIGLSHEEDPLTSVFMKLPIIVSCDFDLSVLFELVHIILQVSISTGPVTSLHTMDPSIYKKHMSILINETHIDSLSLYKNGIHQQWFQRQLLVTLSFDLLPADISYYLLHSD